MIKKSLHRIAFSFSLFFLAAQPLSADQELKQIAITQIVSHPSLNSIREGFITELAQQGYIENKTVKFIFKDAQGNPTIAAQIAQYLSTLNLDLVIPITTPSAQTVVNSEKKIPIIFAAVSDPIAAKIVPHLQNSLTNVTGVMDSPPLEKQLHFMIKLMPNIKKIGFIYNSGEVNSLSTLSELKKLGRAYNITILPSALTKSADIQLTALSIINQVDAIFIGNDNTVVSGLESLIKVCLDNRIPLFASDPDSVKRGALAALAYDQFAIGRDVGKIAIQVLKGKNPGHIPVQIPSHLSIEINKTTANKIGFTFPPHLIESVK